MLYTPYKFPKSNVVGLNESLSEKTDLSVIADTFDATATYAKGDYVIYNSLLYKCTAAHTGAWDANDFTATLIGDEIGSIDLSAVAKSGDTMTGALNVWGSNTLIYEGTVERGKTLYVSNNANNNNTIVIMNDGVQVYSGAYTTNCPVYLMDGSRLDCIPYGMYKMVSYYNRDWTAKVYAVTQRADLNVSGDIVDGKGNKLSDKADTTALADKADTTVIASTFSSSTSYAVGDYVTYNGVLYKCTTAHTGAWNANDFTETTVSNEFGSGIADLSAIAPEFSAVTSYSVGAYVTYEGKLYKCTTAHSGAWNAGDFTETTVDAEKANQTELAALFSASTAYSIGDVVVYNGKLYRFTSAHSAGAWNSSHVTEINVGDQIANYKEVIVTVPTSAWSSTATSGYYTATITTPEFSTALSPNVSCAGASMTATPTAEQMAAYRNIQNPNGYIEQVSSTSIKLYAKTKPTAEFYIKLSGYGIGVQLDSCQSATVANQVQSDLDLRLFRFAETTASGATYPYNGSSIKKLYFVKTKKTVSSGSWSSSANSSGYYTCTISYSNFYLETTYQPNIYCVGSSNSSRPTAAQIAAYRNICEPNGYVDCTSTGMTLYAKTKPTTTFYIVVEGMYFS